MKIVYTRHAQEMMIMRGISSSLVEECVQNPDKTMLGRNGKVLYLKDLGKNYLKVIVKQEDSTFLVITFHWLEKRRVK